MERIIHKYVYDHLFENKLLYEYQSGFLHGYSTVHQLLELYNSVFDGLEKSKQAVSVFCDFSKAPDTVWHKALLHKVKPYGITGDLLKWFKSYLENREKRVAIKNTTSLVCGVSAGVPQGSL